MTALIWFCWLTIGMGYPLFNAFLPQYLENAGKNQPPTPNNIVYRNYAITSIVGVPGSFIAYFTVDIKYIGRKGTIAASTMITGILLFLFTLSSDPSFQLTFSSLEAFFQSGSSCPPPISDKWLTHGQISCMAFSTRIHRRCFQHQIAGPVLA